MARPRRRDMRAAAETSITPPDKLTQTQSLARVIKAEGNNLYTCLLPDQRTLLFELDARFRNAVWIKRGGYVLVELAPQEQKGKVRGEIVNVVVEEKEWRKQSYWPKEFPRPIYGDEDDEDDDEESTVGKMPPSGSEDEE
ncbi:nucleic acid-binding protein [Daldinia caldariorum]|uniref:nucleic acid-binding protein n=1 Tax=Daldinia caldariorum TaxID=326644 RepID=UPI002007F427|nr:nucleic acid-binding protein [Daldinia caldariorum]KAI1463105.1 nucleic acid-binding protein [Daldinia caldariorum]